MKKRKLLPISFLCLAGMLIVGCGGGGKSSAAPGSSSEAVSSSSAEAGSSSQGQASSSIGQSSSQQTNVPVTGISLDQTTASILLGQTKTLVATVAPSNATEKGVTWSSEDRSVASVDQNGVVTANAVGTTKIKAKATGGNFTAECEVTVIKNINSVTIKNKDAFTGEAGFLTGEVGSLNVEVDPKDNVADLLAAGALVVTSSDPTVARTVGLQITGVKGGKTTIKVELFGKSDSFELTVEDPAPGQKMSIADAFEVAKTEAPFNGSTGKSAAITTTVFEFECCKVLAMSRYFDSKTTHDYTDTSVVALVDDGTAPLYVEIQKKETDNMPFQVGDYVNLTCTLTNYYGLFEGIHRNAKTGKSGAHMRYEDAIKLDGPTTTFTPTLNEPETMTGEQYKAYYDVCKTNGTKGATTYTLPKYVNIEGKFDEARSQTDKGGYIIYDDTSSSNKDLGLQNLNEYITLDDAPDGHVSTFRVYLIGANTGKDKSNGFIMEQTPKKPNSVAINQANETVVINGNTLQMSYTTSPDGSYARKVKWESSDPTAATIDDKGLLTGVYQGNGYKNTTVTLTLGEGADAVTSSVTIRVLGEEVHARTASMNKETLSLVQGQKEQLTVTTDPVEVTDKAQWAVEGDAVTVDQSGNVTAVKEGTATVTATLNASASARCVVTVAKLTAATNYVGASVDLTAKLVAVNGKNAILDDGTGGIWAYNSTAFSGVAAGDIVNVKGTTKIFNSGLEVDKATLTKLTDGSTVTESTAVAITQAEAESYVSIYNANDGKSFIPSRKVSMRTGVIGDSMGQYYLDWTTYGVHFETNYSTGGMVAGKIYDVEGILFKGYKTNNVTYLVITITKAEEVNVTPNGISLDKDTLSLEEGKTAQLKATIAPEGASATVEWTSSADAVATVDQEGKVTAVAAGTATIKAAISESLYAECAVTVTAAQGGGGGETPVTTTIELTDANLLGYSGTSIAYPTDSTPVTATVDGVGFAAVGCAAYGDGIQMRTKNGITSAIYNTDELDLNSLEFTWAASKDVTAGKPYNLFVEFSNKADFSELVGSKLQVSFDATTKLASATPSAAAKYFKISHANQGAVYLGSVNVVVNKSTTPVEIAQPVGNFSGYATSAADSSNVFTTIALGQDAAFVEVGSLFKTTTTYTFNKETGLVTINLDTYGVFTATYDEANNKLVNGGIDGAAAAYIGNNNAIELAGAAKFYDCDGTTEQLQATFLRRYMSGSWQEDQTNADRLVSYENGIAGSALQRRGWTGGAVALNAATNFEGGLEVSNIGFWVYNPGASDVSLRQWVYKADNRFGDPKVEIGNVTAVAGQWTYCRMGFTKATIYNFQVADFNNSGIALVFDNIALF